VQYPNPGLFRGVLFKMRSIFSSNPALGDLIISPRERQSKDQRQERLWLHPDEGLARLQVVG
jgi:hypothetical protein